MDHNIILYPQIDILKEEKEKNVVEYHFAIIDFHLTCQSHQGVLTAFSTYSCPAQLLSWHILSHDYHLLFNHDPVVSCPVVQHFKGLEIIEQ